MSTPIEDYALIGDFHTAALVSRGGSIDWLCLPRFDSPASFAALLGTVDHGRWLLAPRNPAQRIERSYRADTLVLETKFETDEGSVTLVDFMPPRQKHPTLVRIVQGVRGTVPMHLQLVIRNDYGSIVPWVRSTPDGLRAIAGPDMVSLHTSLKLRGEGLTTVADFDIHPGEQIACVLVWQESSATPAEAIDPIQSLADTTAWWQHWSSLCTYQGRWREAVVRSLITLKALTYHPTGGIVAAATTSLPEQLGGVRNWDYRFCWVRDATFTLYSLLLNGYKREAMAWREWLLRAVAGTPAQMNILYGVRGERRLNELELDWLPGYENSKPVRIGNAAYQQLQLDVFGEVMDAMHLALRSGITPDENAGRVVGSLLEFLESAWDKPDEGIWEIRGPRRDFTHSKVMVWVAFDRMVKLIEQFGVDGPLERYRALRSQVHSEVCRRGFDAQRNTFVQYFGSTEVDASLLMIPLVGFLPAEDPRVAGTVAAIERELLSDGFVQRYSTGSGVDGLPPGEGAFLPCTFWLVDNYKLLGRVDEAEQLFERLLSLRNDVGLLSEEYDPHAQRLVGNFPQAFSHVSLINSAVNLEHASCPAHHRRQV
jgi:GH15 family glucan-1,4-alpha-glucosidase